VSRGGYMISKNAKNPEAAIKYIDWLQSDIENYLTAFFGVKDKHWKYTDPQNKIMEGLNRDYIGEYITGGSFAITVQYRKNDPVAAPQFDYMGKYITDMTRAKKPSLLSVEYKFDQKAISQKVPTLADITRMIDQEVVKFIMGARPISEFDKFLQELNKAGLDKWIDAYTSEYNRVKG
ncbi:MAG: transporter substrate-binding protein, partial [Paenibacillus sp.]|nr:transporter substrate-binding protein [Paenibacillus sp.]